MEIPLAGFRHQGEIDDYYTEIDWDGVNSMDHALASHDLRVDAEKAQDRANMMKALLDFLEAHPEFKTYYDLTEAVRRI